LKVNCLGQKWTVEGSLVKGDGHKGNAQQKQWKNLKKEIGWKKRQGKKKERAHPITTP